ncbi:MAG: class IV adenylate cyclase [Pirellulales bacterium]
MNVPPSRNIELKARIADLSAARGTAERIATARPGHERQRDTYFACARGRLKLRKIEGRPAQLIAYERADHPDAKASDYRLLELADEDTSVKLRELLEAALGITVIVEKTREVFLHHNVRIHLDEVVGLGSFLEFEAVVAGAVDDAAAHTQVAWLQNEFGIAAADLMNNSYSDMLCRKNRPS